MKLTPEIKDCINNNILCWFATSSTNKAPNVSPKELFTLHHDDSLLIANVRSPQTAKNVQTNPQVCVSIIDIFRQKGYQLYGTGELIRRKDPRFEELAKPLLALSEGKYPFASLFQITITQAKPIIAPSYLLYPDTTTEAAQIQAALQTYRVHEHLPAITVKPIAYVSNSRKEVIDDNWGTITSQIELAAGIPPEAFEGIEDFSHLEIIFYMNRVKDEKAIVQYRHPRNNTQLPKLGTYAQRNKNRPNKLGLTTVELLKREGNKLIVKNLDAIDGTPILDIKPIMEEFLPQGAIRQAEWTKEILKNYW